MISQLYQWPDCNIRLVPVTNQNVFSPKPRCIQYQNGFNPKPRQIQFKTKTGEDEHNNVVIR